MCINLTDRKEVSMHITVHIVYHTTVCWAATIKLHWPQIPRLFPDFGPFPWLLPDRGRIPWHFPVSRNSRKVMTLHFTCEPEEGDTGHETRQNESNDQCWKQLLRSIRTSPRQQANDIRIKLIDWLGFNDTFSTSRLHRDCEKYVAVKKLY